MFQTQFKGIKQTTLSKFTAASDKQSYLWFVNNGGKKQIYLGETLYGEFSDEALSAEDIVKGLTIDDNVIKLTDKDGNAFGEGISVGDIVKGNIIHEVYFDEETKILSIKFQTADETETVDIDFSDLVDTPDKIVIDKDVTGLEEDKTLNDVLSDIYSKFGKVDEDNTTVSEELDKINDKIDGVKEDLEDFKNSISEMVALEETSLEKVNQGHIALMRNENDELYGVMYYMSDIVSGTLTAEDIKDFTNAEEVSLDIADASFEGSQSDRLNIAKKEDVNLYNVNVKAENLTNSGVINIKDSKEISLEKLYINQDTQNTVYNGVEIGLNTTGEPVAIVPNKVSIKNCDFDGEYRNNIINIFGTDDNTVINIENCHFGKCSNVFRLSNRTNANGVVINLTNCAVDEWDTTSEYAGLFICQDYTSDNVTEANLFGDGKITINIKNLRLNGVAVDENYDGQLGYVFGDNVVITNELGDSRMPVVNFV